MQEQIDQLKRQVEELTNKVDSSFSLEGMSYNTKEIIRNEVIKGEDSITAPTRQYTVVNGQEITLPTNPTGILVLKWRGKEYKLFYV